MMRRSDNPVICRFPADITLGTTTRDTHMQTYRPLITCLWFSLVLVVCDNSYSQQGSAPKKRDVIDDAYLLCKSMGATGLTTECSVSGSDRAVNVTIDTTGAEARKICKATADLMAQKTDNFASQWKLRIYSPYSGNRPIAACTLD